MALNDVDKYVNEKLKEFRKKAKVTQPGLAAALDVSTGQIQKYETGINRISPGKLWLAAQFFRKGIWEFFPMPGEDETS